MLHSSRGFWDDTVDLGPMEKKEALASFNIALKPPGGDRTHFPNILA
jgi:hypothetical protein